MAKFSVSILFRFYHYCQPSDFHYLFLWMTDCQHIYFILHLGWDGVLVLRLEDRSHYSPSTMWILGLKLKSVLKPLPTKPSHKPTSFYFWDRVTCIPDLPWLCYMVKEYLEILLILLLSLLKKKTTTLNKLTLNALIITANTKFLGWFNVAIPILCYQYWSVISLLDIPWSYLLPKANSWYELHLANNARVWKDIIFTW